MKHLFILILSTGLLINSLKAQESERNLLSIGIGAGIAGYNGELVGSSSESILSNTRPFFNFSAERRFGKILGIELGGMLGKLSYNENTLDTISFRNFESNVKQIGVNFIFNFDNDIVMKKQSPFSPYIAAGAHLFNYNSSTDLLDENGIAYQYWDDGSIRTVEQNSNDASFATPKTKRDYSFETPIEKRNTMAVPMTLGLKWKISERVQGRLYGSYVLLFSDKIDNVTTTKQNDHYYRTGFSLHYILMKKKIVENKPGKVNYDDVDFKKINLSDKDKDGVIDLKDDCQGTPWNAKVDKRGCPLDGDGDGVPDYIDQELNTEKGMSVDELGHAITDSLLQARIEEKNRIVTERKTTFSEEATTETLNNIFIDIKERLANSKISSKAIGVNMPEKLKSADTNKDGLIETQEIQGAFDGFFEGTNDFSVKDLNTLVDYFFEQ